MQSPTGPGKKTIQRTLKSFLYASFKMQSCRSAAGAGGPGHGVRAVPVALALDSEVRVRVIMMVRVRQPRSLRGLRVSGSQCRLELSQEREAAGCGPLHFHSERLHFKSERLHFKSERLHFKSERLHFLFE